MVLAYLILWDVMKSYSTGTVAQVVGVHKRTLLRWLYAAKIQEPKRRRNGGVDARLWNDRDVKMARRYKEQFYRKGRGGKPKAK